MAIEERAVDLKGLFQRPITLPPTSILIGLVHLSSLIKYIISIYWKKKTLVIHCRLQFPLPPSTSSMCFHPQPSLFSHVVSLPIDHHSTRSRRPPLPLTQKWGHVNMGFGLGLDIDSGLVSCVGPIIIVSPCVKSLVSSLIVDLGSAIITRWHGPGLLDIMLSFMCERF